MKNLYSLLLAFGVSISLVGPNSSYADWGWGRHGTHQYYRYHDHPHFGVHVANFYPNEYFPVSVGGARYYYDDGVYYNSVGGDYVVVSPPVGAVVGVIPSDFQPTVINGVTYYVDNGTYYVRTSNGYQVVSEPAAQTMPVTVVGTSGTVTINVPSDRGGFVTVTLRRSGTGYVGPQGEFYHDFPRVSELQTMYGK